VGCGKLIVYMDITFCKKGSLWAQAKIVATIFACAVAILGVPSASFAQDSSNTTSSSTQTFAHNVLYVTGSAKSIASLSLHVSPFDIVAPQTYTTTPKGRLLGRANKKVLDIAQKVGASVMPLVSNQNFSQKGVHAFLNDPMAQNKLLSSLVSEAQNKKYIGYQYDFEHMAASDRDLYSQFVAKSAVALHASGLQLSVAVAPQHSQNIADYGPGSWQNWTGAFDYAALGASADFVSIMAYDDSNSVGPVASIPWITQVANYTLARIPASKVSFGVPFYAWVDNVATGKRVKVVGYPALASILDSGKYIDKGFDTDLGVAWVTYRTKTGRTLKAWYEDAQSFQAKLDLIKSNNMNGFSAWALGLEDPKVWGNVLALHEANNQVALR